MDWGYAVMSAEEKKKIAGSIVKQLEDFILFVVNLENKLS